MSTTVDEIFTGGIADINIGAAAAVGFLNPLGAQLDAMIAFGLGPLQFDLAASLDASIALSASLSLSVSNPFADILAALSALVELQASLTAALSLPPLTVSLGAELSAAASLSAALSAKLGLIKLLLDAAIAVKIPAIKAAANLNAVLAAGPFVVLTFDGLEVLSPGTLTLQGAGNQIQTLFSGTIGSGPTIGSAENVSGVIIVTKDPLAFAALGSLIITS
jgi:hypothetical protein